MGVFVGERLYGNGGERGARCMGMGVWVGKRGKLEIENSVVQNVWGMGVCWGNGLKGVSRCGVEVNGEGCGDG